MVTQTAGTHLSIAIHMVVCVRTVVMFIVVRGAVSSNGIINDNQETAIINKDGR